jgi:hypothetical protein
MNTVEGKKNNSKLTRTDEAQSQMGNNGDSVLCVSKWGHKQDKRNGFRKFMGDA